jgi:hypothetical protein
MELQYKPLIKFNNRGRLNDKKIYVQIVKYAKVLPKVKTGDKLQEKLEIGCTYSTCSKPSVGLRSSKSFPSFAFIRSFHHAKIWWARWTLAILVSELWSFWNR